MPNKRKFRRVKTTMACRPAGLGARLERPRLPADVSLSGARIYLDEPAAPGARLELDLFLPDGILTCTAEVVWIEPLPPRAPARFDAGVHFHELRPEDRARLEAALEKPVRPWPLRLFGWTG